MEWLFKIGCAMMGFGCLLVMLPIFGIGALIIIGVLKEMFS